MTGLVSIAGAMLFHAVGSVIRVLVTGTSWRAALRSPSSAWFGLALVYGAALGWAGLALSIVLVAWLRLTRQVDDEASPEAPWWVFAIAAVLILARPWVPTMWDEFVWLAKARLSIDSALDPVMKVTPAGYPPLWPSAVAALSLGIDSLAAHVTAGSVLVLLAGASALEAWWHKIREAHWAVAGATLMAPLMWVHARSTYVDLPLGLLSLAMVGFALKRQFAVATVLAVMAAGFKDEGVVHAVAASAAVWFSLRNETSRPPAWRIAAPALTAFSAFLIWRALTDFYDVESVDHVLRWPSLKWLPAFGRLLVLHASDLASWGVFWAMTGAVLVAAPSRDQFTRSLSAALAVNLLVSTAAVDSGPEQVRVFAENGTLINRLLMQWWPLAAMLVVISLTRAAGPAKQNHRKQHGGGE